MPKWGLTQAQAESRPWGLEPTLLEPDKTNTDPIHESIYLTALERHIVDSPPFQRLRRIRQLGTAHLVYPGAVHTRFQHSLGALRVAQDLFDHLIDNPVSRRRRDDLLSSWRDDRKARNRKFGEALILARLGALLHDLCHVPFGHTVEDDFGLLEKHDANEERFRALWTALEDHLKETAKVTLSTELKAALRGIILSKTTAASFKPAEYAFVADIVGNTICADLIDYLRRDYFFTGLPARFGSRFLSYFFVTPAGGADRSCRMALRVTKSDRRRDDVLSEVFKFLRYRYELGERVLHHHAKVAADVMIGKAVRLWIERSGEEAVETEFRARGDDEILSHLASLAIPGASDLAAEVLDRRLYKEARCARNLATFRRRESIWKVWGPREKREQVEGKAARVAGIQNPHYVLLSVPDWRMRLKAADVLVWDGRGVVTLREWEAAEPASRAEEIAHSHEALWSVRLFVHPSLSQVQRNRVAAVIADEMQLTWDERQASFDTPAVFRQAADEICSESAWKRADVEAALTAQFRSEGLDGEDTIDRLKSRTLAVLKRPPVPGPADPSAGPSVA